MTERKPRGFRMIKVQSAYRLTPSMQRLRFAGDDIRHFSTNDNLHVRLHLPTADGVIEARYYTIRRIDADEGWFDVDFVLHDNGPGATFARDAVPGTLCGVSGPCGLGIEQAGHYLLAGDETALPAIARIVEIMPRHATGLVLLEAPLSADRIDLDTPEQVTVEWFFRAEQAEQGPMFLHRLEQETTAFRDRRDCFIWIAGEHGAVMPLRKVLARRPSLCVPYWRRNHE